MSLRTFTCLLVASAIFIGCAEQPSKSKSSSASEKSVSTHKYAQKGAGLSLRMPAQGKVPYKYLVVSLEKNCLLEHPIYPEPNPEAPTLPPEVEFPEVTSGVSKHEYMKAAEFEKNEDLDSLKKEDRFHEEQAWHDCYESRVEEFEYTEEKSIEIDQLSSGDYDIYVQLISQSGETLEDGQGVVTISPGIMNFVRIELQPIDIEEDLKGQLNVEVIRPDQK